MLLAALSMALGTILIRLLVNTLPTYLETEILFSAPNSPIYQILSAWVEFS